jgi:SAM-dependent methyltransferase
MICPLCDSVNIKLLTLNSCKINQCKKCTLQFIDIKEQEKNKNYLKKYQDFRKEDSISGKLREIQYSLDIEYFKKLNLKGNILDVGCSTGIFLNKLNEISNLNLYGIDTDYNAIELAKKKNSSKIKFINTDIINYKTNLKFDCIIFRGSFQFLGKDLKETLKKISKISSKNIKIIIYSLPNSDSILYNLLKDNWHLFDKFSHSLIFNKNSIIQICKMHNYKIHEYSYPYLETPYANYLEDNKKLIQLIKGEKIKSFPFWGNIIQVVLKK